MKEKSLKGSGQSWKDLKERLQDKKVGHPLRGQRLGWKSIMANRRRRPRGCRSQKLVEMIGDSHLQALRFLPVYLLIMFQDHHCLLGRLG